MNGEARLVLAAGQASGCLVRSRRSTRRRRPPGGLPSDMRLHIRRLVVWPNDPSLDLRSIEFSSDGISVISGWSSTGKSAVAAIIDYVPRLGSLRDPRRRHP